MTQEENKKNVTLLTTEQLMQILDISRPVLIRLRDQGLPHIRLSERTLRYDYEQCRQWIEEKFGEGDYKKPEALG